MHEHLQGFNLDEQTLQNLEAFVHLFQDYNKHTNLSAIRKTDEIWQKHIIDSLMPLKFEKLNGTLLDIGTGGGLPAIPLAIALEDLNVRAIDSVGKKIKACNYFISELGLKNVITRQARAEDLAAESKEYHHYDIVVARATAYLPKILDWAEVYMKPDGKIILYKTPSKQELSDGEPVLRRLKLILSREHVYELASQERRLLVYRKK